MTIKLFILTLILLCHSCIAAPVTEQLCESLIFEPPNELGRIDWIQDNKHNAYGGVLYKKNETLFVLGENTIPQSKITSLNYQALLSCLVKKSSQHYDSALQSIVSNIQVQDLPCRSVRHYLTALKNNKSITSPSLPRNALENKEVLVDFLSESGALTEWANAISENNLSISSISGKWLERLELQSINSFILSEELKGKIESRQCDLTGDEQALLKKNVGDQNIFITHGRIEFILK